ncbi:response regulator [Brevundimonas sp. SORGH_AS_0993]|uniref:response regulator n=1 Tax=Brevundimonas sp. SORGH_AS_0993 TaxID=3041794 RepID=UPI00278922A1|nr:response regulator [Brevundimonas sp. SORGH_AS_0993]MDQ1154999.1 CheY-like chemotaxis protein/nitrogen-specific signal transduction histidine kinase [Brevundimonas sp. SORGH_AS_0993]
MARRAAKRIEDQAASGSAASAADPSQQFLRLMSHEMRTPLNGVVGMINLLERTRLDGAQRAYAEAARQSAEHLLGLVNDLLDYARLEAGSLEFDLTPVDPEHLVRGVAELLSPRAHDKGLEMAWSVAADVPRILADEGRLRQVLFNLAGNAVKFTETGGVRIAVERAGGEAGPDQVRLSFIVDDTGPGVAPEARERIFEEFGHADSSDAVRYDGAGLGLAVVRKLATAMEGTVRIEDRPGRGRGARFRFEAAFPALAGFEVPRSELAGLAVAVQSPDPFVRSAAADQIRTSGGKVSCSAPIILVDHAAAPPGQTLAALPETGRAIVLLKPSERDLIARYRVAGAHGYLIKPLRRASLVERVRAAAGAVHSQAKAAPARPPLDDRVAPARFAGTRVLLVEDNPVGALLARTLLRREGCVVETAATGVEAVEALQRARYDLVFMDMRMPGMDGPAAARAIRAAGDVTPIVALTANAFAEDRRTCLEAGMNDHLTKPLDAASLRTALARWTKRDIRAKVG